MKENISIIIPARLMSRRFPRKPLTRILGTPMVVCCAQNAIKTGLPVYVCTDSNEIEKVCKEYSINCILTPECNSGTDRVAIAADYTETDYVINLQGDEPLIDHISLNKMINCMSILTMEDNSIISGVEPISKEEAIDSKEVKCALTKSNSKIQYLSRQPLLNKTNQNNQFYYKQLGLYGFSRKTLKTFSTLPVGDLEEVERVELLRGLENGFTIYSCILENKTISIDTEKDLDKLASLIKNKNYFQ